MSTTEDPRQRFVTTDVGPAPMVAAPTVPATPAPMAAPVAAAPVLADGELVSTTVVARFTPDALVAGLVGMAALIVGLIVVVRAGLSSPLSQPVVKVLGFTHTATLGLAEVAIGVFLLLAAASRSRGAETFAGLVMVVAGVVGVAQTHSFIGRLALERGWAWIILIAGAVVAAVAMLIPRVARRSTTVRGLPM